jgi:hypothetical protein
VFAFVAAIMFALWCWSVVPPIENWSNPNEDGFSYIPAFWATITVGGAIAGNGYRVARARTALFLGAGVIFLVLSFLIFQHVVNSSDRLRELIG